MVDPAVAEISLPSHITVHISETKWPGHKYYYNHQDQSYSWDLSDFLTNSPAKSGTSVSSSMISIMPDPPKAPVQDEKARKSKLFSFFGSFHFSLSKSMRKAKRLNDVGNNLRRSSVSIGKSSTETGSVLTEGRKFSNASSLYDGFGRESSAESDSLATKVVRRNHPRLPVIGEEAFRSRSSSSSDFSKRVSAIHSRFNQVQESLPRNFIVQHERIPNGSNSGSDQIEDHQQKPRELNMSNLKSMLTMATSDAFYDAPPYRVSLCNTCGHPRRICTSCEVSPQESRLKQFRTMLLDILPPKDSAYDDFDISCSCRTQEKMTNLLLSLVESGSCVNKSEKAQEKEKALAHSYSLDASAGGGPVEPVQRLLSSYNHTHNLALPHKKGFRRSSPTYAKWTEEEENFELHSVCETNTFVEDTNLGLMFDEDEYREEDRDRDGHKYSYKVRTESSSGSGMSMGISRKVFGDDSFIDDFANFKSSISLKGYIKRLFKYCRVSDSTFVIAIVYIIRLWRNKRLQLVAQNVHKVVLSAVIAAAKFNEDATLTNRTFASVGGIPLQEMNHLECTFMGLLSFRMDVTVDEWLACVRALSNSVSRPSRDHLSFMGSACDGDDCLSGNERVYSPNKLLSWL